MIIRTEIGAFQIDLSQTHTITVSTPVAAENYLVAHAATLNHMYRQAINIIKNLVPLGQETLEDDRYITTTSYFAQPDSYTEI